MKKLLPLLLPVAVLALASCSSEPSDWRPDKKVSLDMIPPGTRPTDNFDQGTDEAPSPEKGAAIPRPINSGVRPDHVENPTPAQVMSADTQEGTAETKEQQNARKRARGEDVAPSPQAGATQTNQNQTQGGGTPDQKN
jgi:hypothetical protein